MAKNIVRQYRLDFSDHVSAAERGAVNVRMDQMGLLSSVSMQTEHSGPFGLEHSHRIEYILVTTLDDFDDALFKRAATHENCFSVCTVTQIK